MDRPPTLLRLGEAVALMVLLLGLALVGTTATLLAAQLVDPTALAERAGPLSALVERLSQWAARRPAAVGIGGAVVGLSSLGALIARLGAATGRSRRARQHLLDADDKGFVVVDSRGVSVVAARAACRADGVVDCAVDVTSDRGSTVSLRTDVLVHPGTSVKDASSQVRDGVREAVERIIGLDVSSVGVRVRVLEPEELARVVW